VFIDFRERPNAGIIICLALIGLPVMIMASWIQKNYPEAELVFALTGTVGLIFCAATFGLLLWLVVTLTLGWLEWGNEIRTTTARLKEMQQAERLSAEQLAVIPRLEYGANIAIHMDPKGLRERRFFLVTVGGMVPWEFCQQFLMDCGVTALKAISNYSEGTQGYDHARWFTQWLRDNSFAIGGDGSRAGQVAQWMTEQSKSEACVLFDVDLSIDNLSLRRTYTAQEE
jgi:hypothetical protein